MFMALSFVHEKTGETTETAEGRIHWQRVSCVQELGLVKDMADALEKFPRNLFNGYSPILEWVGKPH